MYVKNLLHTFDGPLTLAALSYRIARLVQKPVLVNVQGTESSQKFIIQNPANSG